MTLHVRIRNMQRRFVHIQSYCPIVLFVSTSPNTLASLHNGLTTALSRLIQLQTDVQGVGVDHISHSETGDAWLLKAPTAHRVFEMPFEWLVPVFYWNTAEDIQIAKPACEIGAVHNSPMHPWGNTPLQLTPRFS